MSRQIYYAFTTNEYEYVIQLTKHFSIDAAKKRHGGARKLYRGSAQSDYSVTVLTKEQIEKDLSQDYWIDWDTLTLTQKYVRGKDIPDPRKKRKSK